ncbi:WbqC family protein [Halothiobacillus diazotrophicus]|uniref:WbqC family protein n=1 Tax=Halothiobacillus diazotrophicus TaxID=1860122 RepID=UPI0009EEB9E5|nr:WbqC family protein [Halothiobacillus diazotrophicus]
MKVAISQSMLFPWVGLLEQVKLADIFVHYDDVQYSKGGFVNRVQIKTKNGIQWLTIPLKGLHLGQRINEVEIAPRSLWLDKNMAILRNGLSGAPYATDAIELAFNVFSHKYENIGELARSSLLSLLSYLQLDQQTIFIDVEDMNIRGNGSERVLSVVRELDGSTYISGHGGVNYLNHILFEQLGINVEYMDYSYRPYPQQHGQFTPFVSSLDLIANCGHQGQQYILPKTINWREFTHESL